MKTTGSVLAEKPSIGIEPTRLYDASRFENHGTHTNVTMVQLPSGLWIRSLDGDDAITLPSRSDSGTFTVCIWFRTLTSNAGGLYCLADANTDYISIGLWSGQLSATTENSDFTGGHSISTINDGVWHFGAVIKVTDNISAMYIDGLSDFDAGTVPFKSPNIEQVHRIGHTKFGVTNYFITADIALPKVYKGALSAGQIKNKFEKQRPWFGV